ncbi:hypothetical protein L209DRAFT_530866 [Thermothelomyces heterothallicus CBS 203.75]
MNTMRKEFTSQAKQNKPKQEKQTIHGAASMLYDCSFNPFFSLLTLASTRELSSFSQQTHSPPGTHIRMGPLCRVVRLICRPAIPHLCLTFGIYPDSIHDRPRAVLPRRALVTASSTTRSVRRDPHNTTVWRTGMSGRRGRMGWPAGRSVVRSAEHLRGGRRGRVGLALGDLDGDAVDDHLAGLGVAQRQQGGRGQQQSHHDHGADLGHVAGQGGDQVDQQLGGALEEVLDLRLSAEPGIPRKDI